MKKRKGESYIDFVVRRGFVTADMVELVEFEIMTWKTRTDYWFREVLEDEKKGYDKALKSDTNGLTFCHARLIWLYGIREGLEG